MLEVDQVAFSIRHRDILQPLSLSVQPGQCWAIIGANGAGKSTLLSLLSGRHRPTSGRILLHGQPLERIAPPALARQRAMLGQHPAADLYFTVEEVVMMGRYPYFTYKPCAQDWQIVREMMRLLRLEQWAGRPCRSLSGGEQQRVHFARCLAQIYDQSQALVLFDEPTNHLDPAFRAEILGIIRELADRDFGVVAVMHDLNAVAQYADHALLLADGSVVAQGQTDQVMQGDILSKGLGINTFAVSDGQNQYWITRTSRPRHS